MLKKAYRKLQWFTKLFWSTCDNLRVKHLLDKLILILLFLICQIIPLENEDYAAKTETI